MDGKKCFRKKNKNHQLNFLQPQINIKIIEKIKKLMKNDRKNN